MATWIIQEEEHEDEDECQNEAGLPAGFFLLIGEAAPFDADVRREMPLHNLFERVHGLPRAVSFGGLTADYGRVEHVEALDTSRSCRVGGIAQ